MCCVGIDLGNIGHKQFLFIEELPQFSHVGLVIITGADGQPLIIRMIAAQPLQIGKHPVKATFAVRLNPVPVVILLIPIQADDDRETVAG